MLKALSKMRKHIIIKISDKNLISNIHKELLQFDKNLNIQDTWGVFTTQ